MSERKVSTDALETLGTIIDDTQKRDAIHLAVIPVLAGTTLHAGQSIRVTDGVAYFDLEGACIVDPFLQRPAYAGENFWAVLRPRLVQSLRHVWSHPAFPDEPAAPQAVAKPVNQKFESEAWIRQWAAGIPLTYEVVMSGARDWVDSKRKNQWGEYLCFGGLLEGESVPDEFWPHYERVTGETVDDSHRGSFFTCSC